jgi:hypothetical protein
MFKIKGYQQIESDGFSKINVLHHNAKQFNALNGPSFHTLHI